MPAPARWAAAAARWAAPVIPADPATTSRAACHLWLAVAAGGQPRAHVGGLDQAGGGLADVEADVGHHDRPGQRSSGLEQEARLRAPRRSPCGRRGAPGRAPRRSGRRRRSGCRPPAPARRRRQGRGARRGSRCRRRRRPRGRRSGAASGASAASTTSTRAPRVAQAAGRGPTVGAVVPLAGQHHDSPAVGAAEQVEGLRGRRPRPARSISTSTGTPATPRRRPPSPPA